MTLRELVEKATPGPWSSFRNEQISGEIHFDIADAQSRDVACIVSVRAKHTAELLVALRNIAPALVEFYEAATGDLDDDVRHMLAYGRLVDAIREATK